MFEHSIDLHCFISRPIITFIVILLLPSALTFLTLLIHRIRAARAAQRDRAPETIVHNLPWCVWTGTGWEKHEGPASATSPVKDPAGEDADSRPGEATDGQLDNVDCNPSSSHNSQPSPVQPWFASQVECAICLSEFVKGDRLRILPCHHIFHMDEVDSWLIQRKKLCPICKADVTKPVPDQPERTQDAIRSVSPGANAAGAPNERTPLLRQDRQVQP